MIQNPIYVPVRLSQVDAEYLSTIAAQQKRSRAEVLRDLVKHMREFSQKIAD